MSLLWLFFTPEMMPIIIGCVGLALIVGAVTRRRAFSFLVGLLLLVVLTPFLAGVLGVVLDALPLGLLLLLGVFGLLWVFRTLAGTLLGGRAGDHMVGILAADVVRLAVRVCFALLLLPFRLVMGGLRLALGRQW